MKIALDVLGGDLAPMANIEGAIEYLNKYVNSAARLILVVDENTIDSSLKSYTYNKSKIQILYLHQFKEFFLSQYVYTQLFSFSLLITRAWSRYNIVGVFAD